MPRQLSHSLRNWNQTLITIGTILPVIIVLGGLILSRSNSSAVTADKVNDQDQEIKTLQKQVFQLQLQLAREECQKP